MSRTDVPMRHGASGLVLPVPTLPFAMLVGFTDILLIGGVGLESGAYLASPAGVVLAVLASLGIYAAMLCLFARGDPRIWRDPVRLRHFMAPDRQRDRALIDEFRALTWQAGSVAIGGQAGGLAGLAAAACLSSRSGGLALAAFLVVGGGLWMLIAITISGPDRAELAPLVDRADRAGRPTD